jgi:GSH-dependent disulfide-bond oxidoreductase
VTLDHPIFTRWPAQYPDRLQLFSAPTPNGVKVVEPIAIGAAA